ncbi:MAG: AAA family ATPase [Taibaiella sp.]|nr:AAA family ATPase [Taibaiella sp.]
MYLKDIWISNYRTISGTKVEFEPGLNIFIGKNGVGKSNLLMYIDESVDFYTISRRNPTSIRHNNEFEFTVGEDTTYNNCELTVNHKSEKIVIDGTIKNSSVTKVSSLQNRTYIYKNIVYNDLPKETSNEIYAILDKDRGKLFQLQIGYIKFRTSTNLYWLTEPGKFIIDEEDMLDREFNYSLKLVDLWGDTIEVGM